MCLKSRTPFLAVESNTPKTTALLRDVLHATDRVVDRCEQLPPLKDLGRWATWTENELQLIEAFLRRGDGEIKGMIRSIAEQARC